VEDRLRRIAGAVREREDPVTPHPGDGLLSDDVLAYVFVNGPGIGWRNGGFRNGGFWNGGFRNGGGWPNWRNGGFVNGGFRNGGGWRNHW
jgi:rSAM-associated Gly-rich repeat protein